MSLVELPTNTGGLVAVNPHAVTGVQPYTGTLPGTGQELHPMSAVWVHDRNIFVCAWSVENTLAALNTAKHSDAEIFAAGFRAGLALEGDYDPECVREAWDGYLRERKEFVR